MSTPAIRVRLDRNGRVYQPGETLSGEYQLEAVAPDRVKAVEWSVLWHSEGKGDEDLAVHEFRRISVDDGQVIEPGRPEPFSTVLPASPLSYEGQIVKLRWCIRVRAFFRQGKEVVGEETFRLGDVPAPEVEVS